MTDEEKDTCKKCMHRWMYRGQRACGKQCVTQVYIESARSPSGDCGPEAKHFKPDPDVQ